jgi:uncharacterized RDD family membrane protein YckC
MSYQPPPPPQDYGYQQPPPPYGYQQQPQAAYANWGYRVGSRVIDSLIAAIPAVIGWIIALVIGGVGAAASQNSGSPSGLTAFAGIFVFLGYLGALAVTIWNDAIRQGSTGQSIGKQVLGTRLVSLQTGQPIGGGMAFVRLICHIIDGLPCYIGYLWPLWDAQRQTFADKIVGTVVVRTA